MFGGPEFRILGFGVLIWGLGFRIVAVLGL